MPYTNTASLDIPVYTLNGAAYQDMLVLTTCSDEVDECPFNAKAEEQNTKTAIKEWLLTRVKLYEQVTIQPEAAKHYPWLLEQPNCVAAKAPAAPPKTPAV